MLLHKSTIVSNVDGYQGLLNESCPELLEEDGNRFHQVVALRGVKETSGVLKFNHVKGCPFES